MKKRQKEDLRAKTKLELEKLLSEKQKKLVTERIESQVAKPKDIFSQAKLRQEVAVIKTIIREKQFEEKTK